MRLNEKFQTNKLKLIIFFYVKGFKEILRFSKHIKIPYFEN